MKLFKTLIFILINAFYIAIIFAAIGVYDNIFDSRPHFWEPEPDSYTRNNASSNAVAMLTMVAVPLLCTAVMFRLLGRRYKFAPLYNRLSYIAALLVPAPYLCGVAACYLLALFGFYSTFLQYTSSVFGIAIGVGCILAAIYGIINTLALAYPKWGLLVQFVKRDPKALACVLMNVVLLIGYFVFGWASGVIILMFIADWYLSGFFICCLFFILGVRNNFFSAVLLFIWTAFVFTIGITFAGGILLIFCFSIIAPQTGAVGNMKMLLPGGLITMLIPFIIIFINRSISFFREVSVKNRTEREVEASVEGLTIASQILATLIAMVISGIPASITKNISWFITILLVTTTVIELIVMKYLPGLKKEFHKAVLKSRQNEKS